LITTNRIPKNRTLHELLECILAVGNFMNQGTFRANAKGFELEALDIISGSKSNDSSTTLLEVIVNCMEEKRVDMLGDELNNLFKVVKTNVDSLNEQLRERKEQFTFMKNFLQEAKDAFLDADDKLVVTMTPIIDKIQVDLADLEKLICSLPDAINRLNNEFGLEGRTSEETFGILQRMVTEVERIRKEAFQKRKKASEEQEKRINKLAKIRKMLDELDEGNRSVVEGVIDQLRNF
jgi:hypothetical protein